VTNTPPTRTVGLPPEYLGFLAELKARIAASRTRATFAVNSELIELYREIGQEILRRKGREGWARGDQASLERPPPGFPGHEGTVGDEPAPYAGLCPSLTELGDLLTRCEQIALGAQSGAHLQARR